VLRVGRYRVLSELGRGGMSNVYLAVARGPGGVNKLVVLKALLADLATEPSALTMFLDEVRIAAQLNHPNVVQTYEVGTEGDRHVMVMEYLEGQSLSAIVKRAELSGARPPARLMLRVIMNALEGLHYAHELSSYDGAPLELVHRDVSPQNIFVTYDGQVKVLDFGIAKAASSSTHTATGVVKGKIAYMAPEQTGAEAIDRRADVYSVGSMLWAVAAGQKLWKDTPDVQIMRRVINGEVPTPQSVNPGCDNELNRIVMKALALDPSQRFQSALEMQHELERYAESTGGVVKQKEIAQYVSTLFEETRAKLKLLIERQLALVGAEETPHASFSATPSRIRNAPAHGMEYSRPSQEPTMLEGRRRKGRGGFFISIGIVGLLVAAGVLFFRLRAQPSPPTTAATEAKPTEALGTPAPAATGATLHLSASPPQAKLFLDDQELPSNPASKLLPIDGSKHRLRAEAEGFLPEVVELSPTQDDSIVLALKPAPASSSSGAPRRFVGGRKYVPPPAKMPPPTGNPVPSARPPDAPKKSPCEQPFFLDSDGIKKIRPECL
jgi:serine/threonine-protein kinase